MGILRKDITVRTSTRPDPLVKGEGAPISVGHNTYDPDKNYTLIVKGCPDMTTAPTGTTAEGWWICAYISSSQGGTGAGCYDANNLPIPIPCNPFINCWPTPSLCASVCPQTIVSPGGNTEVSEQEGQTLLTEELRIAVARKNNENPIDYRDDPEFGGAPPPPPSTTCQIYNCDVWRNRIVDATVPPPFPIIGTIPDCYPLSHPGQGCPVQPGDCWIWQTNNRPCCLVERTTNVAPINHRISRMGFYCSTCAITTCPSPPCTPNGIATNSGTQPAPAPIGPVYTVAANLTGTLCTDCTETAPSAFYHCLHNTDPVWSSISPCISLSAGTIVFLNPFGQWEATNGTNTYRLSNTNTWTSDLACQANCKGGCLTISSGGTNACNYDPTAQYDDGSCCFESNFQCVGCGDNTATNYCPACCAIDNNLCLYPGQGCTDNTVGVYTDINGNATCGPLANQYCENCNYDPIATTPTSCCNNVGCMNSIVGSNPDVNGNFTCGPFANVGCLAYNYDPNACCPGYCCSIAGCTDPTAGNYDPAACHDDGSCFYPVYGCTDFAACNYDWQANTDDGSCYYAGCLDTFAINTQGTGSYPPTSYDCSCNYLGTDYITCCIYIFGCLDPNAYNFAPSAQGCDNGNGIPDPTLTVCCLYPTWHCNDTALTGPAGSAGPQYCIEQNDQLGDTTKEECYCQCQDTSYPVDCCTRDLANVPNVTTAECCIEYFLWSISQQVFIAKGRNEWCLTGDMTMEFSVACANAGSSGSVAGLTIAGIIYGQEVIYDPLSSFGTSNYSGCYTLKIECAQTSPPSYAQVCIDYHPTNTTILVPVQYYYVAGFVSPCSPYDSCTIGFSRECGEPDCYLPAIIPNNPTVECCILYFGMLIGQSPVNPAHIIVSDDIGTIGTDIGIKLCGVGDWYLFRRDVGTGGSGQQIAAGHTNPNTIPNYSIGIVAPLNTIIEYTLFYECDGCLCYQDMSSQPNPLPWNSVPCRKEKFCIKNTTVMGNPVWKVVYCTTPPPIPPDNQMGV